MKNRRVFAFSMVVLWGIVFANALNDVTIGICMGLLMGMAFGLFDHSNDAANSRKDKKRNTYFRQSVGLSMMCDKIL